MLSLSFLKRGMVGELKTKGCTIRVKTWRYINSGYKDPYYNMACDEAIFNSFSQGLVPPTFRIYMWEPQAVSLGVSQKVGEVLDLGYLERNNIHFVKRMTGGQALLHADEITYSISCSSSSLELPKDVRESYKTLTSFLMNFYKGLGLEAGYSGRENRGHNGTGLDICFTGREKYDVLVNGKKIGGNAQRRVRNNIFQHGSIPLHIDFEKIRGCFRQEDKDISLKATALGDNLRMPSTRKELAENLKKAFSQTFGIRFIEGELTPNENTEIEKLVNEKYAEFDRNYKNEKAGVA